MFFLLAGGLSGGFVQGFCLGVLSGGLCLTEFCIARFLLGGYILGIFDYGEVLSGGGGGCPGEFCLRGFCPRIHELRFLQKFGVINYVSLR